MNESKKIPESSLRSRLPKYTFIFNSCCIDKAEKLFKTENELEKRTTAFILKQVIKSIDAIHHIKLSS